MVIKQINYEYPDFFHTKYRIEEWIYGIFVVWIDKYHMKIMWKLISDHRLSILCPMICNGCGFGAAVSKVTEKRRKKNS